MPLIPPSSRPPEPTAQRSAFSVQRSPRAFTLVEILVTVAIIIILVAITIGVGTQVKANASARSTHVTLKTLEGIMKDYLAAGNPEPQPPPSISWPYGTTNPPIPFAQTTPASDPVNWVAALRANPEYAKKLSSLSQGNDLLTPTPNVTILDSYGTPIRYIPYAPATRKEGYFVSAGPDRVFSTENVAQFTPQPPTPLPQDDLYSTDP